jgi:hypothetical protein
MKKSEYTIDPKFPLGNIVVSGRVVTALRGKPKVLDWMLGRHQSGDWGNVSDNEKLENDAAIAGFELKSAYRTDDGQEFWVVTDSKRKFTTVMLTKEF